MERVYIHSNDINVIKQIIDYTLASSDFIVCGICMNTIINVDEIYNKKATICLIQESDNTIEQIRNIKTKCNPKNVAIIYMCDAFNENIQSVLHDFVYKEILINFKNVYDIIQCIYMIFYQRRNMDIYERMIGYYLNTLYIKENLRGYHYLKKAISLKIKDSQMKMSTICDRIAREYHVTSSRVNRCMRTSIAVSYDRYKEVYNALYSFDDRPTCTHLISKIVEEINQH